jgi:hypothetical protein
VEKGESGLLFGRASPDSVYVDPLMGEEYKKVKKKKKGHWNFNFEED